MALKDFKRFYKDSSHRAEKGGDGGGGLFCLAKLAGWRAMAAPATCAIHIR